MRMLLTIFVSLGLAGVVADQAPDTPLLNHGVESGRLGGRAFQLNGRPATKREIDAAIRDRVPDDSKKFRLVATGDDAERKRIGEAWEQVEAEIKTRVAIWSVPANHWSLQNTATGKTVFRTGGITFMAPDGKVLHRQPDFAGSDDFTAIRKAIRAYDADKDPDLRKQAPVPIPTPPAPEPMPAPVTPSPPANAAWIALFAIMVINYFFNKRGS